MLNSATINEKHKISLAERFVHMLEQMPEDMQKAALYHIEGMLFYSKALKAQECTEQK